MPVTSRYCRIELLGTLKVLLPDRAFDRFRTQKTALLLAYLAHHCNRSHPREQLIALLWPEADLDAGRDSLTTALGSLRRQLEPAGVTTGSVLEADRQKVRLNPDTFTTDVAEFETLLASAISTQPSQAEADRTASLRKAVDLYRGEFLPGYYEDWVLQEQTRLAERYRQALLALAALQEQAGELEAALAAARQALSVDPHGEEICGHVMRLLACLGQPAAAIDTFQQLEARIRADLNASPGRALRELAEQIRREPEAFRSAPIPPSWVNPPAVLPSAPPSHPPATSPTPSIPIVLPLQLTGFFGRRKEVKQLTTMLNPHATSGSAPELYAPKRRLVTLTGPGGVGKTRLAIETARELAASFAGGVWFVSLADVPHPRLLPFALAHALQVQPAPNVDLMDQIVDKLKAAPTLLVLDNFEHLLQDDYISKIDDAISADASVLVRLLLERVPQVSLLVTSWQALNLGGEQEFAVDALATPPAPSPQTEPESLLDFASVALYQDRAQYVLPDFAVTPRNAAAVGQLCRKLEGMPLALEMAAAWVKTLSPGQMLEHLESRLDLLVSRRRDLPARQRSLRATIEWGHDLLSPESQAFFAQLSIFRGGWDVEAAATVCDLSIVACLNGLSELQQHSLLVYEEQEGTGRYRLLEMLRQFGEEKLQEAGLSDLMQQRHRDYFTSLALQAQSRWGGPEQADWLRRLEDDNDNLRTALQTYIAKPTGEKMLVLCASLYPFWDIHGHWSEGRAWCEAALAQADAKTRTTARAQVLHAASGLARNLGDFAAVQTLIQEYLELYEKLGDRQGVADALSNLGTLAESQGDFTLARRYLEQSLAVQRELEDWKGIARSLTIRGVIDFAQGDLESARLHLEQSLALHQEKTGNRRGIAMVFNNLGLVVCAQGDYAAARDYHEQSLALKRELGDRRGIAASLMNLGSTVQEQGDCAAAQVYNEEALAIDREIGNRPSSAQALINLGALAVDQGNHAAALNYYEESLLIFREIGNRRGVAFALEGLASLLAIQGDVESAARLWGAAETLREAIESPRLPQAREKYEQSKAAARSAYGAKAFHRAFAAGAALPLEQIETFLDHRTAC